MRTEVFDTDAHVEESEATFAALAGREDRPRIIEGERRAFWLIEGRTFPKLSGSGVHTFGSPHAKRPEGHVDPERRARVESQELSNPKARLQDMDAEGIDVSVVFPTMFLVWPLADDPGLARALCRSYNDWIAERCAASGGRIRWVATVPLPDVEGSVEEIAHAKRRGASGVMTLGTAGEMTLGNRVLDPFYAACERNGLPVCVHVGWSYPPVTRLYDKVYEAMITPFVLPVFMAFASILANGVLDRFPALKVGFFEAGVEWVPYWLDRMERFFKQPPGGSRKSDLPGRNPVDHIRENRVYFSCELDEKRIAMVSEAIGDDCILYSSDLPHAHRVFDAIALFRNRQDVPASTKAKILANGARFFSL
ncbi:MAG TPA: amidohydrolase family protein [Burkholderiales bacterium]|jgi:predicted TIM-barrel fold metal-dependent hydrolase|nr:amidohydrolase family protein [Burkholderiales bacterium]